jgi:hypothetical protein
LMRGVSTDLHFDESLSSVGAMFSVVTQAHACSRGLVEKQRD